MPFGVIWHNRRRSPSAFLSHATNAFKRGRRIVQPALQKLFIDVSVLRQMHSWRSGTVSPRPHVQRSHGGCRGFTSGDTARGSNCWISLASGGCQPPDSPRGHFRNQLTYVPSSPISASFIAAQRISGAAAAKGTKNAFHRRHFNRVMTPEHGCCHRLQVFCQPTGGGDASAQSLKY